MPTRKIAFLYGADPKTLLASVRHSLMTSFDISANDSFTKSGSIIESSRYPKKGMKSVTVRKRLSSGRSLHSTTEFYK